MKYDHITPEQWETAFQTYTRHKGKYLESLKAAFATLPDAPPMLLPITDKMPPVPEGWQRIEGMWIDYATPPYLCTDSNGMDPWRPDYYLDIQLPPAPDPLAKKREAFEKLIRECFPHGRPLDRQGDGYLYASVQIIWQFHLYTTN